MRRLRRAFTITTTTLTVSVLAASPALAGGTPSPEKPSGSSKTCAALTVGLSGIGLLLCLIAGDRTQPTDRTYDGPESVPVPEH